MKMMLISDLRAGDVLLCYKDAKIDPVGGKISRVTDSAYTHAAICFSSSVAAEATVCGGVSKVQIDELIKRYDHVAIFRQPDAWQSTEYIQDMNAFIDFIVASKAKYNLREVLSFKKRSEIHQSSLAEQLNAFFDDEYVRMPMEKQSYFCSELVASCFIVTGFIGQSAAVLYKPSVISPGALGRDPTFGTFCGYVSSIPNYSIPETDEFFNNSTFADIFIDGQDDV